MSNLYLSRIELENFRTFGLFALDLPPAPGLTLLVGTNGLGKSSFFDGLEWGLTGKIRRFTDHLTKTIKESDYLTRRDAKENSHQVSLFFNQGAPLRRSATVKPEGHEIIGLLKSENWAPIDDLSTYLAFTHFLGQTAQQRFTSRRESEQWESLKGPSGIDRLEEVRSSLRRTATRNAFRHRLMDQQAEVEKRTNELLAWQNATAKLVKLRQAAETNGALSGPAIEAKTSDLVRRFEDLTGKGLVNEVGSAGERLLAIRVAITNELTNLPREEAALAPFEAAMQRYTSARAAADMGGVSLATAEALLQAAKKSLAEVEESGRGVQAALAAEAAREAQLSREVADLTATREALEQISALEAQQREIDSRRSAVSADLDAVGADLRGAEAALAEQRARSSNLAAMNAAAVTARSMIDEAAELSRLETDLQRLADASKTADASATSAMAAAPLLQAEVSRLRGDLAAGALRLHQARLRASVMANAVAQIASHLAVEDESCPVCATHFGPGALKLLAEASAAAQDAFVAPLEIAQAAITSRIAEIESELSVGAVSLDEARLARATVTAALERADGIRRDLGARLEVDNLKDLASYASKRHDEAATAVSALSAEIEAAAQDVATAGARQAQALQNIERLRSQTAELDLMSTAVETSLRRHLSTVANAKQSRPVADIDLAVYALTEARKEARHTQAELEARRAAILSNELGARQRVNAAAAERSNLLASTEAARRDLDALNDRWLQAGFEGQPSIVATNSRREDIVRRRAGLAALLDEHTVIAAASAAMASSEELGQLIVWMEQQAGDGAAENPRVHEEAIGRSLAKAQADRALTHSAQAAVYAYTDRLKKEAEDFSTRFLAPLNDLIDDYNRALLSTPSESIRFNAAHNVDRTKFDMGLRYQDQLDEALYDTTLPPQIVLSEGQMAANGFSILCAASTAYPWSRWRALLLDDPLQHNDIIHAAAFVDVMRNLVELQGYQLLISSHDRAEGDFFARKFDAAGLPCTVVALTAPSKAGVKFDPPRYNAAARALIG